MKRMTHKCADGNAECNMSKDICFALHQDGEKGCWGCDLFPEIIDRLASIEDILGDDYDLERLEVMMTQCMSMREEVSERFRITGSIPVERLRELIAADKQGRCEALPCKGWLDLVFGEQEVFWAIDYGYDNEKIREITVRNEERFTWFDGWKTVVFNGTDENGLDYEFSPEDIGKTVFLNRESAESALAKEADHE